MDRLYIKVPIIETVIISFTIDGTSYQAESGMTWGQWVESSYNTNGYLIISNEVYYNDGMRAVSIQAGKFPTKVLSTDTIIESEAYLLQSSGGSGN